MKGKLIVFEGVSGTGKETQAKLLQTYLLAKGIRSHIVFHPTSEIKPVLKAQKTVPDQLRVLATDRKSKVKSVILPALARGEWVISLRNYVSAYVYQGNGRIVEAVDRTPDYLFYFYIDPATSMKRIVARGETLGLYETIPLLKEKQERYKNVLKNIPHIAIDAGRSIDEIHADVVKSII